MHYSNARLVLSLRGSSLAEIAVTIAVAGILAGIAMASFSSSRSAVTQTKLRTDVAQINRAISVYLASGGSLEGIVSAQDVLESLKTTRTAEDAKRQVGGVTGRSVDVRLAVRMQSQATSALSEPRAVWNPTTKRFDIVTTPGASGIADFILEDSRLGGNVTTQSRERSAVLYNKTDGWIWESGNNVAEAPLTVSNTVVPIALENLMDPLMSPPGVTTSGSTTSGSSTTGSSTGGGSSTLPKPINAPAGGTYPADEFPTAITIDSNGATPLASVLKYRINGGTWKVYGGSVPIQSGDVVDSKNFTILALLYGDSAADSDTYYLRMDEFTGTLSCTWTNASGGPNLEWSVGSGGSEKSELSHGNPSPGNGSGTAGVSNVMSFTAIPFDHAKANVDFTMGELEVVNGNTFNNSEATAVTLSLGIMTTVPLSSATHVPLNFTLLNTPNGGDRTESADSVTLGTTNTPFSVTVKGMTYTLQVKLVNLDPSSGTLVGNKLSVYEGCTARASLVGKFVSSR